MNPRKDYTEFESVMVRAFIDFFIECGDKLQFAIDSQVDDDEVRAYMRSTIEVEGEDFSGIGITGINNPKTIGELKDFFKKREGLEPVEHETNTYEDENIGEYKSDVLSVVTNSNAEDAEWNVPCLLFV